MSVQRLMGRLESRTVYHPHVIQTSYLLLTYPPPTSLLPRSSSCCSGSTNFSRILRRNDSWVRFSLRFLVTRLSVTPSPKESFDDSISNTRSSNNSLREPWVWIPPHFSHVPVSLPNLTPHLRCLQSPVWVPCWEVSTGWNSVPTSSNPIWRSSWSVTCARSGDLLCTWTLWTLDRRRLVVTVVNSLTHWPRTSTLHTRVVSWYRRWRY